MHFITLLHRCKTTTGLFKIARTPHSDATRKLLATNLVISSRGQMSRMTIKFLLSKLPQNANVRTWSLDRLKVHQHLNTRSLQQFWDSKPQLDRSHAVTSSRPFDY
ncbi:hypothetical protein TNCV_4721721 [Trichonephila clavipes]|uniref:Uncharacterized protein n=1 Tax=Trichonephila clavipes TaxID=2585209 RepID=A0A8X7BFV2_TRICX|nr:hypothetical protein TNCV_4721721 [Trichonephila clavipes]